MRKFSIVTVCRNAEKTIERTIHSVIAQTYPNKEFVVIDGASSDGTRAILEKYRDKIDVVVSEPDNGIYDAMNKGVARATGDYVIFINADDYFYDDRTLEHAAGTPEADFLFGAQYDAEDGLLKPAENLDALDVPHLFFGQFAHQSIFARRDLFARFGAFDTSYRICADWDWILRCIVNGATTSKIEAPIAVFTVGGASGAAGRNGLLSRERKALLRKNLGALPLENALTRIEKIFRKPLQKIGLGRVLENAVRRSLAKKFPSRKD